MERITDIYLFSNEKGRYEKVLLQEIAELMRRGLISLEEIQGIKPHLRKLKDDEEDEIEK